MKLRRILFVNANNDEIGGADICLFQMATAVRELGYEPIVVLRRRTGIAELYEREHVPVVYLPLLRMRKRDSRLTKLRYWIDFPKTVVFLVHTVLMNKINIVHTNDIIDGAGNVAAWLCRIPSVQHVRAIGHDPRWLVTFLRSLSVLFASEVVCVSNAVRDAMYPELKKKVHVIYDWIDEDRVKYSQSGTDLRVELGVPPDTFLVGCVGRIEGWKGQHIFLTAADLAADTRSDIYFVIIGSVTPGKEEYMQRLLAIHATLRNRQRIFFLGFRRDIITLEKQLDVLVHSSIAPEPFGMTVLEGMYCGAVVVAANDGGVREQITDGVNGYLYQPGDFVDMANKIIGAIDNSRRALIIREARSTALGRFARQRMLKMLDELYLSLL